MVVGRGMTHEGWKVKRRESLGSELVGMRHDIGARGAAVGR